MDRKGGQGVALIRQEVAEDKGSRQTLCYNINTEELRTTIDVKIQSKLYVTKWKRCHWQLNN